MTSKEDFKRALKKLDFIQDKNTRRAGSHIRWHNRMFPNIIIGLADHKNTREISPSVRLELINTMALVVWLKSIDDNKEFDISRAEYLLEDVDEHLAEQIIQRAKRIDYGTENSIANSLPRKLLQEIVKRNIKLNNVEIMKIFRRS